MRRRERAHFNLRLRVSTVFAEDNYSGMSSLAVPNLHPLQIWLIFENSPGGGKLCNHPTRADIRQVWQSVLL